MTPQEKRAAFYRERAEKSWGRGFVVGFLLASFLILAFLYGESKAYGAERRIPASVDVSELPPGWRTWLSICHAEQPRPGSTPYAGNRGGGWFDNVWWFQTRNYSFVGGCGFTARNWTDHKRKHAPAKMSDASITEQLWACERIYRFYESRYSPRYASTVWDAAETIGFFGFKPGTVRWA